MRRGGLTAAGQEMTHVWRLLTLEARRKPGPDVERFMDLALSFYFYWVNFGPLSRGTAACGYIAFFALMLSIGYEIQVRCGAGCGAACQSVRDGEMAICGSRVTRCGSRVDGIRDPGAMREEMRDTGYELSCEIARSRDTDLVPIGYEIRGCAPVTRAGRLGRDVLDTSGGCLRMAAWMSPMCVPAGGGGSRCRAARGWMRCAGRAGAEPERRPRAVVQRTWCKGRAAGRRAGEGERRCLRGRGQGARRDAGKARGGTRARRETPYGLVRLRRAGCGHGSLRDGTAGEVGS